MRFGIYTEMQCPPGKPYAQLYWEILRQIEHADEVGFAVYSTIDHHFSQEFGISANPLALFCAAAQRARRIRFRTALHVLPSKNPMELAGQIAAADILTGGRLECGVGRGHAWLYHGFGIPIDESQARFDEAFAILLKAWTEERFSYDGKFWQIRNARVVPRPLQQPHPPISTGGTSDSTYELAGSRGYGIFIPPLLPFAALERQLGIYREACAKHGHEPNIIYLRPVYLGDDKELIRRECGQYLLNFIAFNAKPVELICHAKEELQQAGYGFYASGALESLTKLSYEELVAQEIAFVGTPAQVIDKIAWLQEKAGITEFDMLANYGGMAHWQSLKQQELFARHVLPAFVQSPPLRAAAT
jgi:alkanesulfonate monooxygenase SsuD/methylene tetrahydromethanopterin reductase-like flavin-dependent oxidoreductase (luciferase family)